METQQAMSGLFQALIGFLFSSGPGFFITPFVLLLFVLRLFKWLASYRGKGSDLEEMQQQAHEYRQRFTDAPQRLRGSIRKRY